VVGFKEHGTPLWHSLGIRIALGVGAILLVSYVVFVYLVLKIHQEFYFHRVVREAERFSTAVQNATNHSMLRDDRHATASIIRDMAKQGEISDIRIYDHDGVIKFSNRGDEVGTRADKKGEACFACHSADKPFSEVARDKRTRIYHHGKDRVLGMISPIYNNPSCYQAACHVHPKEQKVLGVLDMGMSLKGFDTHLRSLVANTVLLGFGTFVAVLTIIGAYVRFRVGRPVNRLRDAAMKITLGDYSNKLEVNTQDQIGECAWAFNLMRDQIRRRTQELTRSREEYKTLFEQVPCFICVVNRDFEIVRQNSFMKDVFKGSTGMHCYQVFKKTSKKCAECHADKTFADSKTYAKEHCGITATGEDANYASYVSPIVDEHNRVLYAMIMAVDIRDRVRLEGALQASKEFQTNLIENSIHGIIATDERGRITIYNRAAESLFGYQIQDVVGDDDLEKYFPKQFVEMIVASHLGHSSEAPRVIAHETSVLASDGESIPVRFSGFILFDKDKTAGAVGFFQDLRTFKQLEREKQASDRLAVVGQTVAGLAHGIKNILTGLEGGVFVVDTALEDNDTQLLHRGWGMIQNNIRRIALLVKDLLSYSKERAPEYELTDPNLLAEDVCALFDIKAHEKYIVIERDFDPRAGKVAETFMDQRGIHTCLSNLVANAVDACEGDTKLTEHRIIVRTKQEDDGSLTFQVSDNGGGMSEETRRKIFASFYSTKGSRGTGLGLMVTSKIVMEHAGEISFTSEEGIGSTFTIVLPPRETREVQGHAYENLEKAVPMDTHV
jgi:PAS domain S-box-containing protein